MVDECSKAAKVDRHSKESGWGRVGTDDSVRPGVGGEGEGEAGRMLRLGVLSGVSESGGGTTGLSDVGGDGGS